MTKIVEPAINETAFCCPHCGAYTSQSWYNLYSLQMKDGSYPTIPDGEFLERIKTLPDLTPEIRASWTKWYKDMQTGQVFFDDKTDTRYSCRDVNNLHLSECFNCRKLSVWIHERLVFPAHKVGKTPSADMPDEIIRDFEEARGIVDTSPRGAAALLRLCIQKLCKHLGQKGDDINKDIGALVAAGLNPLVKNSLDIVRVIGNEAVHPGTLDLKDDRSTALALFDLVNEIVVQMISRPKQIKDMYEKLPATKREAIEKRDSKSTGR